MQCTHAIALDTLRLAEGVRLRCDWDSDLYTLLSSQGAIPLNRTAALVLAHCDGRRTSRELALRLGRNDLVQIRSIAAFIEAARRRRWIVESH
jgi:hypothetical protein